MTGSKSTKSSWEHHLPKYLVTVIFSAKFQNILTLFAFPEEIRKILYTTNAIESLNSVIRKAINNRKIFPSDRSALKVVYLATQKASQKWTMSLRDWRAALNYFAIEFEGRLSL